jgi:serine protease SohB
MEYGLFLAKAVTVLVVILLIIGAASSFAQKDKPMDDGEVQVKNVNERLKLQREKLKFAMLDEAAAKQAQKDEKKAQKERDKTLKKAAKEKSTPKDKRRILVLDFDGDIKASAVSSLREEITAALAQEVAPDEIVIKLSSGGGMVHSYGLASSQLSRITSRGIKLTICVDEVAASGGYMMACIADQILAAPFAIIGSIGVMAQLPNFHRLLKKNDIDFEMMTAGEYKRTLTMFGENTDEGREKFREELHDTHILFKEFVKENRPVVDIDAVATGEVWYGKRAIERGLVDELMTSDEYILQESASADVYELKYEQKKSLQEKLGLSAAQAADTVLLRWWQRMSQRWFL